MISGLFKATISRAVSSQSCAWWKRWRIGVRGNWRRVLSFAHTVRYLTQGEISLLECVKTELVICQWFALVALYCDVTSCSLLKHCELPLVDGVDCLRPARLTGGLRWGVRFRQIIAIMSHKKIHITLNRHKNQLITLLSIKFKPKLVSLGPHARFSRTCEFQPK